jgi:hypothetical protein
MHPVQRCIQSAWSTTGDQSIAIISLVCAHHDVICATECIKPELALIFLRIKHTSIFLSTIYVLHITVMAVNYNQNEHAEQIGHVPEVGSASSTGAPGHPTGLQDTRSAYNPSKGVNPATGATYSKSSAGGPTQTRQRPLSPSPSRSDDRIVGDAPLPYTASTAQRAEMNDRSASGSKASRVGEGVGKGVMGAAASLHVS